MPNRDHRLRDDVFGAGLRLPQHTNTTVTYTYTYQQQGTWRPCRRARSKVGRLARAHRVM